MCLLLMLVLYALLGSYLEQNKPPIGHETGFIVALGIGVSIIVMATKELQEAEKFLEFPSRVFFNMALPLIIFTSGYNMKRKRFFKNMDNIVKFGIFGTILTFALYSLLTYGAIKLMKIKWPTPIPGGEEDKEPTAIDIMFLCSLLCSSDIIAAVTIVNEEEQPKLFSIVLGEGLFNDAVSIVLFETMREFANPSSDKPAPEHFDAEILWGVICKFLKLLGLSIIVGIVFGFAYSYLTKVARFLAQNVIAESFVLLSVAMISYFVAELIEVSAIVSLLTTSIIMSHYAWHNLSPQGKHVTSITFQMLGFASEAATFCYVGLTTGVRLYPSAENVEFIPINFIIIAFFIIIVGRFAAIYITYMLFTCKNKNLSFK